MGRSPFYPKKNTTPGKKLILHSTPNVFNQLDTSSAGSTHPSCSLARNGTVYHIAQHQSQAYTTRCVASETTGGTPVKFTSNGIATTQISNVANYIQWDSSANFPYIMSRWDGTTTYNYRVDTGVQYDSVGACAGSLIAYAYNETLQHSVISGSTAGTIRYNITAAGAHQAASSVSSAAAYVSGFATTPTKTFAFCNNVTANVGGVMVSTNGSVWTNHTPLLPVNAVVKYGETINGILFLYTTTGLIISTDGGATWTRKAETGDTCRVFYVDGSYYCISTEMHKSNDGVNWTRIATISDAIYSAVYNPYWGVFYGTVANSVFVVNKSGAIALMGAASSICGASASWPAPSYLAGIVLNSVTSATPITLMTQNYNAAHSTMYNGYHALNGKVYTVPDGVSSVICTAVGGGSSGLNTSSAANAGSASVVSSVTAAGGSTGSGYRPPQSLPQLYGTTFGSTGEGGKGAVLNGIELGAGGFTAPHATPFSPGWSGFVAQYVTAVEPGDKIFAMAGAGGASSGTGSGAGSSGGVLIEEA